MPDAGQMVGSRWMVLCLVVIALGCLVQAQPDRRWELGAQWLIADFEALGEVPGGFGGRCVYNLSDYLAVDSEIDYFPDYTRKSSRLSPLFPVIRAGITRPHGETEAVAGLRAGLRFGGVGIFAKARPGIVRLTDHQVRWLTDSGKIRGALDLGAAVELYPSTRLVIRIDLGGLYMPLGDRFVSVDRTVVAPTTSWNTHGGIGFAVRF